MVNANNVPSNDTTVLNSEIGSICQWVRAKPNNDDSYIRLPVNKTVADYRISGLIFKYYDIANFASIPTVENFTDLYPQNKTDLYTGMLGSDGKFNVNASEGYTVENLHFWSGVIDKEITFPVLDSGFYCVYIAPDANKDTDFKLPVHFRNYHGNLDYATYVYYTIVKWIFAILAVTGAAIFKFHKSSDSKGPQKLSSVEAVINTYVLLTFIPFMLWELSDFCTLYAKNNVFLPYEISSNKSVFLLVCFVFITLNEAFQSYATLLYAMGLGVIYYYREVASYKKFPPEMLRLATALLLVDGAIRLSLLGVKDWPGSISFMGASITVPAKLVYLGLTCATFLMSCVWFILSFKFYFDTKKKLSSSIAQDGSKVKVVSAFKKTSLAIWIVPVVCTLIMTVISSLALYFTFRGVSHSNFKFTPRVEILDSYMNMEIGTRVQLIGMLTSGLEPWVATLISIGAVYLIWAKLSDRSTIERKIE
ncbi:hypothetical protein KGF57_004696 [Candida theae]|uniref:Uncharacterized protein n=1 Tax=Candida theae TaxID=1198502 RepID=A0AAD5BAM7_9ASCO|nr:uncharacterized protein KGF57_004696 [Candida theae]KAI5949486.1 hypothetical protein KGF57_004696 [Candida theae]